MLQPLSRSPFGKKDAQELNRYSKQVYRNLDRMTPWKKKEPKRHNPYGLKSGEVAVILEGGENLPKEFVEGAKVIRR